ncbi:hypothetical protein [Candidatus Uabimicrobium sp. HlEnr_7]|uniref:hypothetical protein n=1 Tax=Candidatus Uabimicrobium helgolandensis TaxID=3095367 RepID=UPI00355799F7
MKKFFIILSIISVAIYADSYSIAVDDISAHNVNYKTINPCALSNGASYFMATERVYDVKKVAKGNAYDMLIFRFNNKKLVKVDRIHLKLYQLVNVAYDNIKHRIYVVGNRGNKIIKIDALSGAQKTIFQYQKGNPGFKMGPFVICHDSKLYATGWFYDKDQNWLGDYIARIRFTKKGVRFKRIASLDYLFRYAYTSRGTVHTNYYVSGNLFYFSLIDQIDKKTHLMEFRNKKVTTIDSAHILSTFAANDQRIFYITKNKKNQYSHYLKNFVTGEKYKIGADGDRFTYPFMVKDRLVVLKTNIKQKTFNAYVGIEKERYLLMRFLKNETLGAMKISEDAKYYLFMSVDGMKIGTLLRNEK